MRAIGIHEDWTATPLGRTPAQVLARYPKSSIGRCFTGSPLTTVQDLRPKVSAVLKPYLDAGVKIIYISIKTDVNQTRNGNWFSRYQELGVFLEALQVTYGVQIIVIPWHEPEDDFISGTAFIEYYNTVFDSIKVGSSAVKVKPCFMLYHWAPGTTKSIRRKTDDPIGWFDGLKMNDGIAADAYSGRSFPLSQTLKEHPGFSRFMEYLPSEVRWSIGERGWETPSSTSRLNQSSLRAMTMRREFEWLLSSDPIVKRCDDYVIWSSPGRENAIGLVMDVRGEYEIDLLLKQAFSDLLSQPQEPNENHPQYKFGFDKGFAGGHFQGRNSAFLETRNWAIAHISIEE